MSHNPNTLKWVLKAAISGTIIGVYSGGYYEIKTLELCILQRKPGPDNWRVGVAKANLLSYWFVVGKNCRTAKICVWAAGSFEVRPPGLQEKTIPYWGLY